MTTAPRFANKAPASETWLVAINNACCCAYSVVLGDEGDDLTEEIEQAERYYRQHEPSALPVMPMTFDQLLAWEAERIQARSRLEVCGADDYDNALGAVPPIAYECDGDFQRFLLGEATHGGWYQQYARVGDWYATKLVNLRNRHTWIRRESVFHANMPEGVQLQEVTHGWRWQNSDGVRNGPWDTIEEAAQAAIEENSETA